MTIHESIDQQRRGLLGAAAMGIAAAGAATPSVRFASMCRTSSSPT
jgi:hypothetical protein